MVLMCLNEKLHRVAEVFHSLRGICLARAPTPACDVERANTQRCLCSLGLLASALMTPAWDPAMGRLDRVFEDF